MKRNKSNQMRPFVRLVIRCHNDDDSSGMLRWHNTCRMLTYHLFKMASSTCSFTIFSFDKRLPVVIICTIGSNLLKCRSKDAYEAKLLAGLCVYCYSAKRLGKQRDHMTGVNQIINNNNNIRNIDRSECLDHQPNDSVGWCPMCHPLGKTIIDEYCAAELAEIVHQSVMGEYVHRRFSINWELLAELPIHS